MAAATSNLVSFIVMSTTEMCQGCFRRKLTEHEFWSWICHRLTLVQVTSSICVSLPENESFYNFEICHKLPIHSVPVARHCLPAPHSCRSSDICPEVSILPGSDLKKTSLPLSSWALVWTSVLNSIFQTLSTRLDSHQISCMDWRPLQNDNLPSLCPFLLWGASRSFCTLCQILNNPVSLIEPTLS